MAIAKLLLFFLWAAVLPLLTGSYWSVKQKSDSGRLFLACFYGVFIEFALFEFLAIPMVFLRCSLRLLSCMWLVLSLVCAALSLYKTHALLHFPGQKFPLSKSRGRALHAERVVPLPAGSPDKERSFFAEKLLHARRRFTPLLGIVLLCIFLQAACVTFSQHIDDDDAFYVATAVTAVETDTLMEYNPYIGNLYQNIPTRYVLSSWPLYLAALSVLCAGLHPTLIAHLLLPGPIVLFAYLIYALIARDLFADDPRRQNLFLLFVVLILSFSGFSVYSSGVFLFTRGWQGKALVAAITQPALFLLCRQAMTDTGGKSAWFLLFCAVTSACMFSSMGVVLSILPVAVYAVIYSIKQKKWRYLPCSFLACGSAIACGMVYLML
ncbi:MAG: DUF6077 domain-containing protein [Lachnospiraceae bacterium]|nr:DUF6077 domain-containing protein [Lachnospiraceae bacterium]